MPRSPTNTIRCRPNRAHKSCTTSGHGRGVLAVAGEHVVRERPAVDQHQPRHHLPLLRALVSRMPVAHQPGRPGPLEVRAGDVVRHQFHLHSEQRAQLLEQGCLQGALASQQAVQGAVPAVQPGEVHAHPGRLAGAPRGVVAPLRQPAPPAVVADEGGFQPGGRAVLGGGVEQAVGDQREGALGEFARAAAKAAQDAVELQVLVPEGARDQQRAPVPSLHGVLRRGRGGGRALAGEQFEEAGGVGLERIDPAAVAEDALARSGAAVGQALAIGFLQAEVLRGGVPSEARTVTLRRYTGGIRGCRYDSKLGGHGKSSENGGKNVAHTHYIVTTISGNQPLRR